MGMAHGPAHLVLKVNWIGFDKSMAHLITKFFNPVPVVYELNQVRTGLLEQRICKNLEGE